MIDDDPHTAPYVRKAVGTLEVVMPDKHNGVVIGYITPEEARSLTLGLRATAAEMDGKDQWQGGWSNTQFQRDMRWHVLDQIRAVWGDYDDFKRGGMPYVKFLIENDVQDMEDDDWDEEECIEELADVCINAMRMMDERGYDPEEIIIDRLHDHVAKDPEAIIERYEDRYDARDGR